MKTFDDLKTIKLYGVDGIRITPLSKKYVLLEQADGQIAKVVDMKLLQGIDLQKIDLKQDFKII
jgi:hypothetical protein